MTFPSAQRSHAWPIAIFLLACMLCFGMFGAERNPNIISRTALAVEIAAFGKLSIDEFHRFTIDKAFHDGHYYLDKAPGLSLLALPIGFAAHSFPPASELGVDRWTTPDGKLNDRFHRISFLASIGIVSVSAALGVVAVLYRCRASGASPFAAAATALLLAFATPFWGWSTALFGHAAAGGLLILGYALLSGTAARNGPPGMALLAGALLGLAVAVEYTAAPAVAVISLTCAAFNAARHPPARLFLRTLLPAAFGVVAGLAPALVFNTLAFGSPFRLGYGAVVGFDGMRTGFFGIAVPQPDVIMHLLFGTYRGLLPIAPVLALVPLGAWLAWRRRAARQDVVVAVLVFACYLALNAGYVYWHGGYSTGPRHLVPALPFLALLLAPVADGARLLRWGLLALAVPSALISLACVSVDMWVPEYEPQPFADLILPRFLEGDVQRWLIARAAKLQGPAALVPLLAIHALLAVGFLLALRRTARQPA